MSRELNLGGKSLDAISFDIKTFGCKVNTYDSSLLEKRLESHGFFREQVPQIHILNTCAVTAEATKEARREARRLKMRNPDCLVVVTGCAAQVDTDKFVDMKEADLIVANSHKADFVGIISRFLKGESDERIYKSNIFKKEEFEPGGGVESSKTRAFLKIQDGCNSFCTFCVIPFARGKSRSLSVDALVDRVNELQDQGFGEVILTGVHIGDYEDESGKRLEDLVESLLAKTRMPRFRLTSLEPVELSDRLLQMHQDSRLCPHFHMSIQSATTRTLERMKRKYTAAEVEKSLMEISKQLPQAFVGMDVIVGFPGETEDEFLDTYQRLRALPWTRIHVFPYSPRPGTFANRLDGQHDRSLIMRRSDRLRELSHERHIAAALAQVGTTKDILLLGDSTDGIRRGLSRDYWNVYLQAGVGAKTGALLGSGEIKIRITGIQGSDLLGE